MKRIFTQRFLICLSLLPSSLLAAPLFVENSSWEPMVAVGAGAVWSMNSNAQTLTLQPDIQKTYTAGHARNPIVDGDLFLGWQHTLNSKLLSQLGIVGGAADDVNFKGDIWEDSDPDFNNSSYRYNVSHAHVGVKALLAYNSTYIQPYINASVGVGFNKAHGFSITPTIFEQIPAPAFASHSDTTYTYTVGVGLLKTWSKHWQTHLGYEFGDWGQAQFARAQGQTQGQGLALNNLYTQQLKFELAYLI